MFCPSRVDHRLIKFVFSQNCSFDEHSTLPLLSRTLQLIIAVEDLASTNRSLRSGWDERRSAILTIVRDLTAKKPGK